MNLILSMMQRLGLISAFFPWGGGGARGADIGDNIANSLMLDSSASQHLSRTFGAPTNNKIFTIRRRVKRCKLGARQVLIGCSDAGATSWWVLEFDASDHLQLADTNCTGTTCFVTTRVFRDPAAWIDIVLGVDTTQATAANRVTLEIDGVVVSSFSTVNYPAQNAVPRFNSAVPHYVGRWADYTGISAFGDYYDAVSIVVDGQKLLASSFNRISADSGQWVNKNYAGTYGSNGFKLDFSNASALGTDSSGNGNNWTLNGGITSANQYTDTPTNNYCVLNALSNDSTCTLSAGNLHYSIAANQNGYPSSTFHVSTGKWAWENKVSSTHNVVGIIPSAASPTANLFTANGGYGYYDQTGNKYVNGTGSAYGATFTTNDVIRVEIDLDSATNTVTFFKNNLSQGAINLPSGVTWKVCGANGNSGAAASGTYNFGAKAFANTPTTGFKALCTTNLPTPAIIKPSLHFQALLDTGANIKTSLAALFPYYLDWIKDRANANNHQLIDTVGGASAVLQSNTTAAETTYTAPSGSSVGWAWNMGGAAVTNNNGSIASQVSANQLAGQSIITYTGTGANATVGHGLLKAPELMIVFNRTDGLSHYVGHSSLTGGFASNYYLLLNATDAQSNAGTVPWNGTNPTSSVFSLGTLGNVNGSGKAVVAYCFHSVEGYSKVGSYVGNGSADGPFVHCGFKPRWILVKCSSAAGSNWNLQDTARAPSNVANALLFPNLSNAETSGATLDILSNGFKCRDTNADYNASGQTFIFYAVAECPTKYATAR